MNIRKILIALGVVVLLAAGGAGAWVLTSKAKPGSGVAATVNGEAVYWSQVDAEIDRAAVQFGIDPKSPEFDKQRVEVTKVIIDQIVAQRLILQEAKNRNLTASDKDIEEQIAAIKQRFPSESEFNTALARNGLTLAGLRDVITMQLTQRRLLAEVAKPTVTDDEVRRQFEENRTLYDSPAQIKASHILLRVADKSQESVAAAKVKIIQARLAQGAKFEELAAQYSEDPGSATKGGDLGFVSKGTLVKEFEQAAWALRPGEISKPVRSQFGIHIIRVSEIRAAEKATYEKAGPEIREQLLASKREKAFGSWLDEIRKAAKVELFERKAAGKPAAKPEKK